MKQVIRKGIREIIVDEVPDPRVSANHVLVRPVASLISSGTETASIHTGSLASQVNESRVRMVLDVMKNNGPAATIRETRAKLNDDYAVLGYSGAGFVREKHPTVTDLEIGERVAYGGEGTGHGESVLTGRKLAARIPDDVSFEHAAFATLGSIALNGVRTAQIGIGDSVAVIGLGLVGQLTAQLARIQGAKVLAIDLIQDRVALALRTGAEHDISGAENIREQVAAITDGRGADVVIVCAASKSSGPCWTALDICRDRGKIVVVGAVGLDFPWHQAYLKEIRILMSRAYGPGSYDPAYEKQGQDYPFSYVRWTENRNMEEFLSLVSRHVVQIDPLISHRFPLDRAPEAYRTIMNPASKSLAVVLQYPDARAGGLRRVVGERPPKTAVGSIARSAPALGSGAIGVAVVGPGVLAKWAHIPALQKLPNTKLRAIYSSSGARGKNFSNRYSCDYCTTEYERILEDPNIQVVLITSRNQLHASQAVQALRAGKHVMVEKPMAITEQECQEVYAGVRETGNLLTVGFNRRFSPFYRRFRDRMQTRVSPAVISCRVNSPGISGDYWMADPAIGGAILGEACHFVDLMSWMLDADPVEVSAYTLAGGSKEPIGENNMVAAFRFTDGSVGNLTYSTMGSKTSQGELVEVFQLGLGLRSMNFKRFSANGSVTHTRRSMFPNKGYRAQMEAFFECVRTGKQPAVSVYDGVRASIGCIQAIDSAKQNRALPIDLTSYAQL